MQELSCKQNGQSMQEERIDAMKIEQLRRRRKGRLLRTLALVVVAGALVLAYFTGLYGAGLSVLGDVVDSAAAAIDRGEGFPMPLTLTGFRSAQPLSGGFVALGENDLTMVSSSGKELRRIQHGYARPAMSVGDSRVCLYNRSGTELCIESRSRTLFKKVYDQPIQLATINEGGSFAVVTRSARYEAELTVYNSLFEPIYFWYSAKDTPTVLSLSRTGRQVAVACLTSEGGALGTSLYLLDTGLNEPVATIKTPDGILLAMEYLPNGNLLAVYDGFAAIYAQKDGAQLYRYDFAGRALHRADINGKGAALVFAAAGNSAHSSLVILDDKLTEIGAATLGFTVRDIEQTRTNVFLASDDALYTYGLDGTLWGQTAIEPAPNAIINAKELLVLTDAKAESIAIPARAKQ